MSVVLPKELAYAPSLPSLPECSSKEVVLSAVNGNSFVAGNLVQWDFPQQGFLDPASLYIRYRISVPQVATNSYYLKKIPVYTLLQKLEVLFGSQVVETINDYNVWTNLWSDLQLDVAQRYGSATAYGMSGNSTTYSSTTLAQASDGAILTPADVATQNITLSAPLPCILSGAEKLIPLGMMPQVRLQITLESIANAFAIPTGLNAQAPASVTFSNMELCYTSVDFGGDVQEMVKSMGDKIYIKSQSVSAMGNNVSVASVGTLDLIYNQRLASVKSLFATFCPITASLTDRAVNGKFDSIDITSANGSLVFNIAGVNYPQREVSTLYNRSSVFTELRKACGALHSDAFFPCIGKDEFNALDSAPPASEVMNFTGSGGAISATATRIDRPAKFYFGVNTEKLTTNGVLLSGISTQSAPISLRIQLGTATTYGYNVSVFALYDALIEVSPLMRDASIKQ
jgi:hypothetical protein